MGFTIFKILLTNFSILEYSILNDIWNYFYILYTNIKSLLIFSK